MGDSVFVNKRSAIHKGSPGRSTAFPDVNLCPPAPPAGPVPTPLPNIAQAADLLGGAPSVLIGGNPMAKRSSFFARSQGNTVAMPTGGGVISHIAEGKAYFVSHSVDVTVEGEEVPRHLDMMTHNHLAPSPPNAAVGTYLGMMAPAEILPPLTVKSAREPKKDERKKDPHAVEIFIDASAGTRALGVDSFLLASTDGKVKKSVAASQATPKGGLLCVRFSDVPPGKLYDLYYLIGGQKVALFQAVALQDIKEHTPGAEKPPKAPKRKLAEPVEDLKHPREWYEPYPWTPRK
jgi:uncharacterized protein DUF4150